MHPGDEVTMGFIFQPDSEESTQEDQERNSKNH